MTNEDQKAELISRLIETLVDDPRRIELDAQTMPRRVNWRAKVDINDTGKLIGKKAAHLKSIRVLVCLMGQRFGEDWRFAVTDPDDAPRKEPRPIPPAENFNAGPACVFLKEILVAILDESPEVDILCDSAGDFTFRIRAKAIQDYERLVEPIPVGYDSLTPIAALGTLFRAFGRQQGVNFRVEVPSR